MRWKVNLFTAKIDLNNNELRIKRIDAGLNSFLSQFVVVFRGAGIHQKSN